MRETRSAAEIQEIANRLRLRTLEMIWHKQTGHPGGSFSLAEILACLFFRVLNIDLKILELHYKWVAFVIGAA